MDDVPRTVPFPPQPSADAPLVESTHSRAFLLPPSAAVPTGCDVVLPLPDGPRLAYVPTAPAPGEHAAVEVAVDPFVRGNQFKPLHQSERALSALLSIAASRRLDTGPESERLFVFLRGRGLVFMENGDTHRFEPNTLALIPAGEPAGVWSQGPEDVLAVVFQPRGGRVERRTLRGEIEKRRKQQS